MSEIVRLAKSIITEEAVKVKSFILDKLHERGFRA